MPDLNEVSRKYSVNEESPEDATQRRWKEKVVLRTELVACVLLGSLGVGLILYLGERAERVELGKGFVVAVVSYVLGKKGKE